MLLNSVDTHPPPFHLIQMITLLYPAKSIGFRSPHPAEEATSAEDWGDQVPA